MTFPRNRDKVSHPLQNMWYYSFVYFYLSTVDAKTELCVIDKMLNGTHTRGVIFELLD